ncbi:hypothetical protein [Trinickia symbiotica]|uniref:Uncharacterized protein n=1 Tax=Trinickia symbiotica TaxID=863227 RepID=A0A2N7XA37_9BURK|nr:hypothetical protein [Trinickia symbiotica]PMS38450.1 hypothetical protein C0Z20_00765 [Trinickia symbiotica]
MLEKIKTAVEHLRANLEHRGPLAEALEALGREVADIKAHVEGLGHEATGETGAAVKELSARLDSLTSAVSSIGSTLSSFSSATASSLSALGDRVAALEQKPAPAAPTLTPPYAPADAQQTNEAPRA